MTVDYHIEEPGGCGKLANTTITRTATFWAWMGVIGNSPWKEYTVTVTTPGIKLAGGWVAAPHINDIEREQQGWGPTNLRVRLGFGYDVTAPRLDGRRVNVHELGIQAARKLARMITAAGVTAERANRVAACPLEKAEQAAVRGAIKETQPKRGKTGEGGG